jgi:hypothetical protein
MVKAILLESQFAVICVAMMAKATDTPFWTKVSASCLGHSLLNPSGTSLVERASERTGHLIASYFLSA